MVVNKIKEFLKTKPTDGSYGDDYGDGNGAGYGDSSGSGYIAGSGYGYGYSCGYGSRDGDGSGSGSSYGDGSSRGYGYGSGSGEFIKSFNNQDVYYIDGIPCIFKNIKGNIAKVEVLETDFTTAPAYIVKNDYFFAHGKKLKDAMESLEEKTNEELPVEERIKNFIDEFSTLDTKVKGSVLFKKHNSLTGSCLFGRNQFIVDNNLSLEETYTIQEFIDLTKNSYNGEIIKELETEYKNRK